jgi:uncharacterized YkwD family protein
MNKQHNKGLRKTLILGTLALALSIPVGVGAASAASPTRSGNISIDQLAAQYGIDLNALIQQAMQGNYPAQYNIIYRTVPGLGGYGSGQPTPPIKPKPVVPPSKPPQPSQSSGNTGTGTVAPTSEFATQVVTLVNAERAKAGLSALKTTNATLTKMAYDKAKDMYDKGYFDHNSPTYGSPFDMMKQYGITFSYAGENIAKGQPTPQEVMTAWMNSPGHRDNILKPNYTTIGVAYYKGVWVQEFIS